MTAQIPPQTDARARAEPPADRLPPLPAGALSPAQAAAAAAFEASRGVPVFGPFVPLLRSPELMTRASETGLYLRYRSVLPLRISEFVILLVARHWSQGVEWAIHQPIALKAGLPEAVAAAVAEGRRPEGMSPEEAAAHAFAGELHVNRAVSDPTWAEAVARFGEQGAVELAGLVGYYGLLAATMNAARTPVPASSAPPLPPLVR